MRLREGEKRYEVIHKGGSGTTFKLRREDTAKIKARIESRMHPRVEVIVRALFKKGRPVVYRAHKGEGHPVR